MKVTLVGDDILLAAVLISCSWGKLPWWLFFVGLGLQILAGISREMRGDK